MWRIPGKNDQRRDASSRVKFERPKFAVGGARFLT
jgi:hypothetical protein